GLVSGIRMPKSWTNNSKIADFYDVKGDVESLLNLGAWEVEFEFVAGQHNAMHGGQCAEILHSGKVVGHLGAIHPSIKRELDLNSDVFLFEIALDVLLSRQIPCSKILSKFPEVSRDLAILVNNETSAADILASVRENAGDCLTDLRLFDVYQGDAVETGKKSLALGLTWQHPSRTLNDDEVNEIIACCIKALEEKFEAGLRN
ncbi:MAG: phenylalanine--tRNA ligase subunit beta, partial [Gammaproteobacteria bacterium]|nr:phenylalanine--tRNA ligase subunit beta [Gammaproteobacteria bacterium]